MSRRSIQQYFNSKPSPPVKPRRTSWQKLLIVLNALPDFSLAGLFLVTWINPALTGGVKTVWGLMQVILLESIGPPAAAYITISMMWDSSGTKWQKTKLLLYHSAGYAAICVTVSEVIGSFWPCIALPGVIGNRLLAIWTGRQLSNETEESVSRQWLWASACYIALLFLHVNFFSFPRLGVTDAYIPSFIKDIVQPTDTPYAYWELLSFGFLYYLIQGVTELVTAAKAPAGIIDGN